MAAPAGLAATGVELFSLILAAIPPAKFPTTNFRCRNGIEAGNFFKKNALQLLPACQCFLTSFRTHPFDLCEFPRYCVELLILFLPRKMCLPCGYELIRICNGQWTGVLTAGTCASHYDERNYRS
jgi:hypothetical protein